MSPDMFHLSALTVLRQAELTVGELRMGLCEGGQDIGHGKDIVSILSVLVGQLHAAESTKEGSKHC